MTATDQFGIIACVALMIVMICAVLYINDFSLPKEVQKLRQNLMRLIGYTYSWFNKTQFMILLLILVIALSVWGHLLIKWDQYNMGLKERVVTKIEYRDKEKIVEKCSYTDEMSKANAVCGSHNPKSFEVDKNNRPKVVCN